MKKLLLLITLLIANFSNSQESWFPLGPDDFNQPSLGKVNSSKIIHDNNNVPYVVFSDVLYNDKITVRKYINNKWITVGSLGFSDGIATLISIDFDTNNIPYVAYKDTDIKIKKFDGTSWINVGNVSASTNFEFSFKISGNNIPYIAFQNSLNTNKATVKKFNGSNWELVGIDGISVNQANYISLAINNQNVPFIVYSDASIANKVSVQKFENNSWNYVGQKGFSLGQSSYTCINFDNNNIPTIIYSDGSTNSKLTMQKFINYSWQTIGQSGFSSNSVNNLSFLFDSNNTPYIICNNISSGLIEVYYFNQLEWYLLSNPLLNSSPYPSISISKNNELLISMKNITDGNFLEVKKLINNSWLKLGDSAIVITELSKYAIDKQGVIYMMYKSKDDGKAYIKKYENGAWSNFLTNSVSEDIVNSFDIKIDNNNQICIVYNEAKLSGERAVYKRYNGNDFITIGTTSSFNSSITNLKLRFDSNNTPYFGIKYNSLIIEKFENNSWTILGYLSPYKDFDIEIDKNIIPNILYVAVKSSSGTQVKKFENSSFINVGSVVDPLTSNSEDLSLAVINNQVYIAYKNASYLGGNYKIYVKKFDGSNWQEIGGISNTSIGFDNPLLKNYNNSIYLFYNNKVDGFSNLLKYENGWKNIGSSNFSAAKSNNADLLFFNSIPIIIYNSDNGVFGKYYGAENVLSLTDNNKSSNLSTYIYPNPVQDKFSIKTDDTIINFKLYDFMGKEILNVSDLDNQINVSNLKKGVYILKIHLINSYKSIKFIKS